MLKVLICAFIAVLLANAQNSRICSSLTDPHMRTFAGLAYNIYGKQGVYTLAKPANVIEARQFAVQTRLMFSATWNTYSVNGAIAVRFGKNVLKHNGDYYTINNVKNGDLKKLLIQSKRHPVTCVKTAPNRWSIIAPNGERVLFDFFPLAKPTKREHAKFYFNIYVHSVKDKKYTGLCGKNIDVTEDRKMLATPDAFVVTEPKSLFNHYVKFKEKLYEKKMFVSEEERQFYEDKCKKMGLTGGFLKDCLVDARQTGGFQKSVVMRGFKNVVKDLNKITEKNRFIKDILNKGAGVIPKKVAEAPEKSAAMKKAAVAKKKLKKVKKEMKKKVVALNKTVNKTQNMLKKVIRRVADYKRIEKKMKKKLAKIRLLAIKLKSRKRNLKFKIKIKKGEAKVVKKLLVKSNK